MCEYLKWFNYVKNEKTAQFAAQPAHQIQSPADGYLTSFSSSADNEN